MSIWTEDQSRAVLTKVVALSKADECTATLSGAMRGNIRFALNKVTTSGVVDDVSLVVQAAITCASQIPEPSQRGKGIQKNLLGRVLCL